MSDTKVVYEVSLKDHLSSGLGVANTTANKLNTTMAGITNTLAGLGVAYAASAFFKDSVRQWNESEQALAQLNATLKSTGGAVGLTSTALQEQAKALQNVTTYDDDAIIGMQSLLTTFTQIKGAIFTDAVPAIVDLSAKMGTDLKSSAIQVGKALNDPIRGVTALQRVGVSFTKSQKQLIKTLVETNDIAGAQRIILGELATEFGGSAEAMGKAGLGPITMMQNKFNDVKEEIGGLVAEVTMKLLPTIEKMIKGLGSAIKWIQENKNTTKALIVTMSKLYIAFKVIIPVMEGFGVTTTAMLGPLGLAVGAIAAVTLGLSVMSAAYDDARQAEADFTKQQNMADIDRYRVGYEEKQKKSGLSMADFIKREKADLDKGLSSINDATGKALREGTKITGGGLQDLLFKKQALDALSGNTSKVPSSALGNASKTTKASNVSTKSAAQGTKVTTINMSIRELIHEFNINTTNVKEGASKVTEMITNAITGALNDSQLIVR